MIRMRMARLVDFAARSRSVHRLRPWYCCPAFALLSFGTPALGAPVEREFEGPRAIAAPTEADESRKTAAPDDALSRSGSAPREPAEISSASGSREGRSSAGDPPTHLAKPGRRGRGLFAGAGILGGLSVAGGVGLLVALRPACVECTGSALGFVVTVPAQAVRLSMWGGAIGMVAGGAHRLALYRAYVDAASGRRRSVRAHRIAGAVTLGVSLGIFATSSLARLSTLSRIATESAGTTYIRMVVWSVVTDVSMTGAAVGAGLLSYARSYKRERGRFGQVRIVPRIGADGSVGLDVRF